LGVDAEYGQLSKKKNFRHKRGFSESPESITSDQDEDMDDAGWMGRVDVWVDGFVS
jgi:hypothetical protein